MTEFLSDAWLAAMAAATGASPDRAAGSIARAPGSGPATGDELVVQQVVVDGPGGEVAWFVVVDGAQVSFGVGRHRAPAITFTQDVATASAIASGHQSAQGAFMGGQLRVGGDVRVLLDRQDDLAHLDDVFAAVRAATCFPDVGPADRSPADSSADDPSHA